MLCIPTLVALKQDDAELVRARAALRDRVRVAALWTKGGAAPGADWEYLASTPFREDDGRIIYLHVFRSRAEGDGAGRAMGIPAAPGWWPKAQRSLQPRRTAVRGQLRLVS